MDNAHHAEEPESATPRQGSQSEGRVPRDSAHRKVQNGQTAETERRSVVAQDSRTGAEGE